MVSRQTSKVSQMKHETSEKYRKYLILITLKNNEKLVVWGTDMQDEERDKFLLSSDQKILTFDKVNQINDYVLTCSQTKNLFDLDNLLNWVNNITQGEVYSFYNLDLLRSITKRESNRLQYLNSEDCHLLLSFIHLVEDYVYQVSNRTIKEKLESELFVLFKDYVYTQYFWESSADEKKRALQVIKSDFEESKFFKHCLMLLEFFESVLIDVREK